MPGFLRGFPSLFPAREPETAGLTRRPGFLILDPWIRAPSQRHQGRQAAGRSRATPGGPERDGPLPGTDEAQPERDAGLTVLIIDQPQVSRLLPLGECIEVMEDALRALARGEAVLPLRSSLWLPGRRGALVWMPAYLGSLSSLGVKVITYFPGNRGTLRDTHQGCVLLFDTCEGRLLAVVDATEITSLRTAAATAVATRVLARAEAGDLAILGSGTQARTHLEAMLRVRKIRRVRVWSRQPENARRFARRESARHGFPIEVTESPREAVQGADLICTTTSAREPVLRGEWLQAGAHINAVGACVPATRELDSLVVQRSRLFVDRLESARHEAGDFLLARQEGFIGDDHLLGEIGQVLVGELPGRRSEEEITLYKSLGIAVEDVAAAHHVYVQAVQKGIGTRLELGGVRHETA